MPELWQLRQMQSLPLPAKVRMSENRIREWINEFGSNGVCVSFSGGKDSTVLLHIVRSVDPDIPALFVDTGLEYPEIRQHVRRLQNKWGSIEIVRPEMRFDEVLKEYGYPLPTKTIADVIEGARRNPDSSRAKRLRGEYGGRRDGKPSRFDCPQWAYLLEAPFKISSRCCDVMKKNPLKKYQKETGRKPFIGTMVGESQNRYKTWLKNGCNAFDSPTPTSRPLSFWTESDILQYIVENNLPYASVYGEIVNGENGYFTTGCDRTGCMFCLFGCHLEKAPNRFQKMKETHPRQYDYCMRPREEKGLGLREVLEYIGVEYE
jgi:3'-phosphoadenosine 5'-phosphosulfate sulfotransferase (PAPS reductase)/FAD synthetase